MKTDVTPITLERRTQAYGRRLLERLQQRRGSWTEGAESRALALLSENDRLRTRALRLVDVLPGLVPERDDALLLDLARELLGPVSRDLSPAVSLPLRAALSGALPPPVFAGLARSAVSRIGRRFIVPTGEEGRVLRELRGSGRLATFDVLGEAVVGAAQAEAYAARYLHLVDALARDADAGLSSPGGVPRLQVSLKLSALTPRFDPSDPPGTLRRLRRPLERILDAARRGGVAVTWDVEQYALRDLTWWLFQEVFRPEGQFGDWEGAGIVAQAYLRDAPGFVDGLLAFARRRAVPFQVRLVKGAYWDYETVVAGAAHWPSPVCTEKWQTDAQYEALTRTLLGAWPDVHTAVASHNVRSLAHAAAVAEATGLEPEAVEYQTLYGMDPAVSGALRDLGLVARDYVPSGDLLGGMAYLVRRLLENTSQVGFLRRSRIGLDPDALLVSPQRAPAPADLPSSAAPGAEGGGQESPGFVPVAPARLFLAPERERFATALEETHREWGQTVPLRIAGQPVPTSAPPLVSLSPSHPDPERPVAVVQAADLEATGAAIRAAVEAAPAWGALSPAERAGCLRRAAALLLERRDTVAAWEVHEAGKERAGALADVDEAIDFLRYYAAGVERPGAHRPRGVVAVIPPWNFPLAIPAGMTAAALGAGNTVLLKPSEETPFVAHLLVQALHQGGVPQGALILLPGAGETVGQALVESPDVDMVAFTGSRQVGLHIVEAASRVRLARGGVKHVLAEMGGKNAVLVFADADPEEAATAILTSAFGHAGQKCSAASRVLVQRPLFERLTGLLVDGARSLPAGPADDPQTVINPVISERARDGIRRWGAVARQEGRVLLDLLDGPHGPQAEDGTDTGETGAGGAGSAASEGYVLGPLIVALEGGDAPRARVFQEEIFGPVLVVVPFGDEAEGIALANATVYGLTAGVFTRSPARARRVAEALRAGNVYVNREITGARVGIEPFGGVWLSGTGPKAGGPEYLSAFVTRRAPEVPADDSGAAAPGESRAAPAGTIPSSGSGSGAEDGPGDGRDPAPVRRASPLPTPWGADVLTRAERLARAAVALADPALRLRALTLVARVPELALDEPGPQVPGQDTVTTWTTPRGGGLVVVDEGASGEDLVALVYGALLAGNGVALAAAPGQSPLAQRLVALLHQAGVPPSALRLMDAGPAGGERWLRGALALAGAPASTTSGVAFAAVAPGATAGIQERLARVLARPWEGQRWIKALLTLDDAPGPDEAGFLRRFASPRTIAVRTLRHGADLGED